MKKKDLVLFFGLMGSACIGAGGMYLANMKKINFMNRYPQFLEAEEFAEETLEIGVPEPESEEAVIDAYFTLYGDEYTFYEGKTDTKSKEYITDLINGMPTALGSGFKIKFNSNDELFFSKITKGMAADEQGLKVGDIVKSIDGQEMKEYKNAGKLNGEDGTTAKLIIIRDGEEKEITFKRKTDEQTAGGIASEKFGETLYIRAESIDSESAAEFEKTAEENSFEALIVDLRGNGGGYTQYAVGIADLFIGESKTVMYAANGTEEEYLTSAEVTYDVPIVVLVNEETASAAEILTSLLRQYGDTEIVGTNTFGKGIYQNYAIYNGALIRYTEGYFTAGDWDCWQGSGIAPDIEIDMDAELIGTDDDIQLEKAIELLEEK